MFDRMRTPRQRQPLDLSPTQLLQLWTQLLTAYFGENQFAGQTAEIYAYTLFPHSPSYAVNELGPQHVLAASNLEQVLALFCSQFDCAVTVNGRPFRGRVQPFGHRLYVEVRRRRRPARP
jgi:hypothetical protein